eukprot:COSAG03_NODE_296_length_9245_cov_95.789744_6_plen_145_part_00
MGRFYGIRAKETDPASTITLVCPASTITLVCPGENVLVTPGMRRLISYSDTGHTMRRLMPAVNRPSRGAPQFASVPFGHIKITCVSFFHLVVQVPRHTSSSGWWALQWYRQSQAGQRALQRLTHVCPSVRSACLTTTESCRYMG